MEKYCMKALKERLLTFITRRKNFFHTRNGNISWNNKYEVITYNVNRKVMKTQSFWIKLNLQIPFINIKD